MIVYVFVGWFCIKLQNYSILACAFNHNFIWTHPFKIDGIIFPKEKKRRTWIKKTMFGLVGR